MSGFCPDEWHGTTEADLQQMAAGEDYWLYADALGWGGFRPFGLATPAYRAERKQEYAIHDEAIRLAKSVGLVFHELPDKEQWRLMDKAEANLYANPLSPTE